MSRDALWVCDNCGEEVYGIASEPAQDCHTCGSNAWVKNES